MFLLAILMPAVRRVNAALLGIPPPNTRRHKFEIALVGPEYEAPLKRGERLLEPAKISGAILPLLQGKPYEEFCTADLVLCDGSRVSADTRVPARFENNQLGSREAP